ncbi:complex I subunit 4 family protein [Geminisphaera colitermitum]|uniref:complex I subunit 4 family protein n=1 Tax=Geminisphaera colitermitum TaxID=1148786 RepID=UPI000158D643|nr:NADH-quinone oxidoreductase subunit M [Geminisphaera colitermitum]
MPSPIFPFDPLLLSILLPILAAILITAFRLPARPARLLAAVGFLAPVLLAALVAWKFPLAQTHHGYRFLSTFDTGLVRLGITLKLGLNGISLPLYLMASIVGLAAGLYAMQSKAERLPLYLSLLLVMHGGLMGVFSSVDVFFFYFFHELALIPTFIMVGIWGGRDRNYAAMKMTIYLTLGAMLSLIGLIALYYKSGAQSFDIITLRNVLLNAGSGTNPLTAASQNVIYGLLLFGFGILVSLWPLHTWAPLGYGAAPSSAAMLHAGVLKKFGLYGLIQIACPLLPAGAAHWVQWLALLAVVGNILVVGFITIAQTDLKQMVGYSSVMHMGYAFLGLAAYSAMGVGGVVMMMVAHGFSAALLFLLTTSVYHRTQTFDMREMGGLVKHAPVLAAFFVVATMASIGLPGLANFWGELTIFVAAWQFSKLYTALAVSGIILSAIYGLRAVARVFFGPQTEAFAKVTTTTPPRDLCCCEKIPALILIVALFAIGLWPKLISTHLNAAVSTLYNDAPLRGAGVPPAVGASLATPAPAGQIYQIPEAQSQAQMQPETQSRASQAKPLPQSDAGVPPASAPAPHNSQSLNS